MKPESLTSAQISTARSTVSSQKSTRPSNINVIETAIVIPPDGGWGWLIVAASFVVNALIDGTVYTFAIFLNEIANDFHVSPTEVALANSVMTGLSFLSGPLTCVLVNHSGFRTTGFVGGVLGFVAFIIASLQASVTPFVLTLGLIGGLGMGMSYIPSIVIIGFYFSRWRSLATSIAVSGSAVGILSFPIIFKDLLSSESWRMQFRIIGCCFLIVSLLALTYRPLKPVYVATKTDGKSIVFITEPIHEVTSIYSRHGTEKPGFFTRLFHKYHNVNYPTAAQVNNDSLVLLPMPSSSSSMFLSTNALERDGSNISQAPLEEGMVMLGKIDGGISRLSTVYEDNRKPSGRCQKWCKNCCCTQGRAVVRPMYRDDVLYTGPSLLTVISTVPSTGPSAHSSQYRTDHVKSAVEYHLSVTRVSVKDPEEEKVYCWCCYEHVIRTLVTMLHFGLLKSPSFILLALSGAFTTLGMYTPFMYLLEKTLECGIDKSTGYYLYTALGIANGVGRISCGFITAIPHVTSLNASYVTMFCCGLLTALSYFICTVYGNFLYAIGFGITIASLSTLRAPILVELLGLEALTNAFGLILLFQGIAAFTGLPLTGLIIQVADKSYKAAFAFSGGLILFSAFLLFPVKKVSEWEKKKALRNK